MFLIKLLFPLEQKKESAHGDNLIRIIDCIIYRSLKIKHWMSMSEHIDE